MSSEEIPEKAGIDELHDRSTNQLNTANPTGGISFADPKPPMSATIQGGRDLGLRRELTHDEKELANAGYEELESKMKAKALEGVSADISEHKLSPAKVAEAMGTSINLGNPSASSGLTAEEAQARLARDGPNQLTPPKKKSALRKYFDALLSLFNVLLILAGVLEYVLLAIDFENNKANEYLGAILIIVAFLNAFIEWYQGQKADAILASFLSMMPPSCKIVRGGEISSIPAQELVKGDIVFIKMGDKVPADLVLFSASDVKVDNSSLTGESEPQERSVFAEGDPVRPVEARNLLFNSTLVVSGEGFGIVVRTGDHTFIGQIAGLTGGEADNKSPLAQEIDDFVKIISCIAIITAIIFFGVGIGTTYKGKIAATVTFAVSVLVAWVPEGLPATVTLLLSIAAKRMAKAKVLVKDLQGVETLGALTMLATDKTGTLTRNQMTVTAMWTNLKMSSAFESHNDEAEVQHFKKEDLGVREILDICTLCSKVKFDKMDIPFEQREILGDATESGLTRFAGKNLEFDQVREKHPEAYSIPFNSTAKWALVVSQKPHANGDLTLYLKGAPERVLERCSHVLINGESVPVTEQFKKDYGEAYQYMASRGHRVIACAQLLLPGDQFPRDFEFSKKDDNCPTENLCFVGLISLEDPPKHGVREAIGQLRSAGIKVVMVTGDHPLTAEAIARKINLVIGHTKESLAKATGRQVEEIHEDEVDAVVVHGDAIDSLQGWEWDTILNKTEIVFARTSPKHKLEIVKRAQALGHIVGVTGDGVNDSPALKKADLGIAMNISGSDVSKEAANMILLDDNFASVVDGVREGRLIFTNLKRSIQYTVTHSVPEVIPQLLYVIVPIPLPLSAILILVIDLGFELFAALSFAWDCPESSEVLMTTMPRKPVTDRSIMQLKKKALRRTRTNHMDVEAGNEKPQSRIGHALRNAVDNVKKPFSKWWWDDLLEKSDGEALVDGSLLSYSYLQAGMIETVGCMMAYFVIFNYNHFTPRDLQLAQKAGIYFTDKSPPYTNLAGRVIDSTDQTEALAQAQGMFYMSIFLMQCFNMFAVKAKLKFPFGKAAIGNKWNFVGALAGAVLAAFIIYVPPLRVVFGASHRILPLFWLIPIAFGFLILLWASGRVLVLRKKLLSSSVKPPKGLMMHPTKRTMSIRSTSAKRQ
ncbi:hypothetical protein PGT21_010835 [Puccinia graminis f. sp. tritici]|uniref:Cation-transporting P-type ATPase N-terminal domain-containing protein n=2 Tax=Puccinia graminis f. sp. tritici TaxID=56615 RepID=E3JYQ2_PUCGT|nr:uncharacterized protein PGTG_03133 [Puccinia graminis f. sp. tritici CRL 75-36-700-3]EFP77177.2 hypothetical protein PGTG_03133 [Puccinia graminis f. sp. tritici CRL 75-36-700-3]KAA1114481.1 hypothetical protein PGT21_010835 [Puccinia graminis f. sp. tritici]